MDLPSSLKLSINFLRFSFELNPKLKLEILFKRCYHAYYYVLKPLMTST